MEGFAFSGEMVPGMGPNTGLTATNIYTGKKLGESNFSGGDPGLQYRFWNQAENGYASSDIEDDIEASSEEAAFLDNVFKCRRQCKSDQGGFPSLRTCIRACKGKGLTGSALKTKDLEIQQQMAAALTAAASDSSSSSTQRTSGGSKTALWIILGVVALIIIAAVIYFVMRKKAEVAQ